MGKFEETFKTATMLSGGYYVMDAGLSKKEFIESLKHEFDIDITENAIQEESMKFGFPPDNVEDREDFDGMPCWYTGGFGKNCKKAWSYNSYRTLT